MAGEAQLSTLPTQSRNLGSPSSVTDKHRVSHPFVFVRKAGKDNVSVLLRIQEPKMTQKV